VRVLLPLALLLFVPVGLLEALGDHYGELETDEPDILTGAFVAVAVAQLALSSLGDQFYAGVVAGAVSESRTGERRPGVLEIARHVPYLRLIAADLLLTLGTAAGLLLLIVPGVVFYTWFALTAPVIKIEGLGLRAAFRRSRELVRRSFREVLAILWALYLGIGLLTALAQDGAVWALGETFLGDWAAAVVVGVVFTPVAALVTVLLTFELRELEPSRPPALRGPR
jgi:hypothetical protein